MNGWTFQRKLLQMKCYLNLFSTDSSQFAAVILFNGNGSDGKDEHENDKNYLIGKTRNKFFRMS